MAFNFQIPTLSFRLKIILLAIIIFIGGMLLIFTSFFNFGTLEIIGQPPFSVIIENSKSANCPDSPCTFRLAPGKYQGLFQKTDFLDQTQEFSISLNQITTLNLHFTAQPAVNLSGVWNPNNLQFTTENSNDNLILESNLSDIDLTFNSAKWSSLSQILKSQPATKTFRVAPNSNHLILDNGQNILLYSLDQPDQSAVLPLQSGKYFAFSNDSQSLFHLSLDPQTFRPGIFKEDLTKLTLASQPAPSGPRVRSATPATLPIPSPTTPALITLVQDFSSTKLFPSPDQQKLLLLDLRQNSLYLFDFQNKSRQKLADQPNLKNLLWLDNQTFLLENRPTDQANSALLHGQISSTTASFTSLPLNLTPAGLHLIFPISTDQLLIAEPLNSSNPVGFQFSLYQISTQQKSPLYTVSNLNLPTRLQYREGNIYFVSSGNIYQLNLQI
jgi:hypothetical protein